MPEFITDYIEVIFMLIGTGTLFYGFKKQYSRKEELVPEHFMISMIGLTMFLTAGICATL